jgi:hypothetical protein
LGARRQGDDEAARPGCGSAGAGGAGARLARRREVEGMPDGWALSRGERGREGGGGAAAGPQMGQVWPV